MLYSKLGSTRITILYDQRLHYRFESTVCNKNNISKFVGDEGIIFFFQKEKKIDVTTHPFHFTHTQSLPSYSIAFIAEIISVTLSQLIYGFKLKSFNGLLHIKYRQRIFFVTQMNVCEKE